MVKDTDFFKLVKESVRDYVNEYLDIHITEDDIYLVWYCKSIQNWKALATTALYDGRYYELTLNGDKNEMYLDAYRKIDKEIIKLGQGERNNDLQGETRERKGISG